MILRGHGARGTEVRWNAGGGTVCSELTRHLELDSDAQGQVIASYVPQPGPAPEDPPGIVTTGPLRVTEVRLV